MEWRIWITWCTIFYIRYSRLFGVHLKKHGGKTVNPSIRIYVNKTRNRITFKTGYYLDLLTPGTMKLLGSTKSKIITDKNGGDVLYLEIILK